MQEIEDVVCFTKQVLGDEATGHDFFHAQRVARLAAQLYKQATTPTKKEIQLILMMGYLHDTIDEKIVSQPQKQLYYIEQLPSVQQLMPADKAELLDTIQHLSYSKNLEQAHELSIRGKYVQDADRLDALGAIGIARAFAYGGHKGQLLYDSTIPFTRSRSVEEYRQQKTTVHHFYDKLFHLSSEINTPEGRQLAVERTRYMKQFMDQFLTEWDCTEK